MSPSDDFYALLSSLLRKTTQNPDAPPAIPFNRWSAESVEWQLLEDLRATLATLQTGKRNNLSQVKEKEWLYEGIFRTAGDGLIIHDLETGSVVEANPAACRMYNYAREDFIGRHPTGFIHPDSSHLYTKYVQAVQAQGEDVSLQVHTRADGSQFYVEMSGTVLTDQKRRYLLSIVREVSQRVHSEQLLRERVEARTREQSALLEISETLASALELQPDLILDQLRVIIDYTHAELFKLEETNLTALSVRGPQRLELAMPFNIRLENSETLAALFNGQRSSRISDVHSSDPAAQLLRSLLDKQASILVEDVQSWMWVPLAIKGRMIGAIGVAHAERDFFTAHHADLALTVANQAAIMMANAELYQHAQTLAALQERQRLARNLHDAVNQSLFSAGLIAEVLPRLWARNPDEGRQSLEDLRRLTRGAQADLRLLLAELRPTTLTDAELGDLLRLLGNALTGRTNLPVQVTVSELETLQEHKALPADVQVALYRICQEGINNIAKHAGASHVDIQLQYETDAVELRIRDDGHGFDPDQTFPGHYGLSMMQERANAVGATLSITSRPGHGTGIVIRWVETQEQKVGER